MRWPLHLVLALASTACGEPPGPTPTPAPSAPTTPAPIEPTAPVATGRATAVASGREFACALRDDGRVSCWGLNAHGQLGIGHLDPEADVVDVHGLDDAIDLAAGGATACAIRRGGSVVCWGSGERGELGTGRAAESAGGIFEVPGVSGAQRIFGGATLSDEGRFCVTTERGTWCWGWVRPAVDPDVPSYGVITPPHRITLDGIRQMWIGNYDFVLLEDGTGRAWSGREIVTVPGPRSVASVSGGGYVVHPDGHVTSETWRSGGWSSEPRPDLDGAVQIVLPELRPVALRDDGTLFGGTAPPYENGTDITALAHGNGELLALTRDGTVRAWRGPEHRAREVVLPPREVPPEPAPLSRDLADWCSVTLFHEPATVDGTLEATVARLEGDAGGEPARDALCASSEWNTPACASTGAIWAIHDGWLSLVVPGATTRVVPEVGLVAEGGTEQSSEIVRALVRSESPLHAVVEIEEDEQSCDEEGEICGLADARHRYAVIHELADATFVVAEVTVETAALREAALLPFALPLPHVTVQGDVLEVSACLGQARFPIPALRVPDPAVPTGDPTVTAAPGEPPASEPPDGPPGGPPPDDAAIEEAAARCGRGWEAFGDGRITAARADIEAALLVLPRSTSDRARRATGACLYNLGRIHEGSGRIAEAREAYTRSLSFRPNATVETRLRGLPP